MKTEQPLKVVLDTNILLSSVSGNSPYKLILDELFDGVYEAYITTEILLEYEEKLSEIFSQEVAEITISALLLLDNIKTVDIYF